MEQPADAPVQTAVIQQNWEVYGADGQLVGHVNEVHANYVWVQKGLLFPQDMYIPSTACASIASGRVLLSVTTEEIMSAGWDQLPDAFNAATPIGGAVVVPHTDAGR